MLEPAPVRTAGADGGRPARTLRSRRSPWSLRSLVLLAGVVPAVVSTLMVVGVRWSRLGSGGHEHKPRDRPQGVAGSDHRAGDGLKGHVKGRPDQLGDRVLTESDTRVSTRRMCRNTRHRHDHVDPNCVVNASNRRSGRWVRQDGLGDAGQHRAARRRGEAIAVVRRRCGPGRAHRYVTDDELPVKGRFP